MRYLAILGLIITAVSSSTLAHADYWTELDQQVGVAQDLPLTPMGHAMAISAHNAYVEFWWSPSANLNATLDTLTQAINDQADLLELDLVYDSLDQAVKVSHQAGGLHLVNARFDDVLASAVLTQATQPLFLELKESQFNADYAVALIENLRQYGYLRAGRPVYLRSFPAGRSNLIHARDYLQINYPELSPYVRFNEIYQTNNDLSALQQQVAEVAALGFDMVEFNYQTPSLGGHIEYAKSLGLGVGLWTIPADMGEVGLTLFRDEVDVLTTDYDLAAARQVVQDDNQLLYVNSAQTAVTASALTYYRGDETPYSLPLIPPQAPQLFSTQAGQPFFGSVAGFLPGQRQQLSFYDADQGAANGYLVNVLVRFRQLSIPDGETWAIVNKADAGSFAMELHNPSGIIGPQLRYGVHIDGEYRYVTVNASQFSTDRSYYISGAYDGDGSVRLYLNSKQIGFGNSYTGGVTVNDSPVVLAADPQGPVDTRFHADIEVQMLSIQDWWNH